MLPSIGHSEILKNFSIYIATNGSNESIKNIQTKLLKRFKTAHLLNDIDKNFIDTEKDIYIAVGPSALRNLLKKNVKGVVVSVFTSHQSYKEIVNIDKGDGSLNPIMAIYADPFPLDQMRLISLLFEKKINVAVLLSKKTKFMESILNINARQADVELNTHYINNNDDINTTLNNIEDSKVLLVIPDSKIINGETIKNILLNTYRKNKIVVGFSKSLVKAGALATTYSDVDDIVEQIYEILNYYADTGRLQGSQYPKYFKTVINDDVAHSLDFIVSEDARKFALKPAKKNND